MKFDKPRIKNLIFFICLGVLLIPQTRKPIQVFLHKGLALFSPSIETDNIKTLKDYNWQLKDNAGAVVNFQAYKEKVVFVNFWATWCPPCIAEMSSIQKLYSDYKGRIEFVFVSNESHRVIDDFLKENAYTFKVYNPITTYPGQFDVKSIPRTFLIDKKGKIIIDKLGAAHWNSEKVRLTIQDLLDN